MKELGERWVLNCFNLDREKYPNVEQEYRFELQDLISVAGFVEPKINF